MVTIPQRSGGRVRRRTGAISLASGDVPLITPASDPGLRVPRQAFEEADTTGEVLEGFGAGLQTVGGTLEAEADISLKSLQREEGLSRDTDDTTFSQFLNENLRELQKTSDLSDSTIIKQAADRVRKEQERILSEHRGGNVSRSALENRLNRRFVDFTDTLAVLNIGAADRRLNRTIEGRISAITQDVLENPDVITSEDPLEAFRSHSGQLEDEISFLGLRPEQAAIVRRSGQSEILATITTALLNNDQTERVKEILRSEEVEGAIPSSVLRDISQRVVNFERKREEQESQPVKGIPRDIFDKLSGDEQNMVIGAVPNDTTVKGIPLSLFNSLSAQDKRRVLELDDESPEAKASKLVDEQRAIARELGLRDQDAEDFVMAQVGEGTENERATRRLLQRGIIDKDTADKLLSGVIRIVPLRDEFGNVEGSLVVDLSEPETTRAAPLPQAGAPGGAAVRPTEAAPALPSGAAVPTPTAEAQPSKRSLFNIVSGDIAVTGIGPEILEKLQGVFGQLDIQIADQEQLSARRTLDNAKRDLAFSLVPNARFPQNQVNFILETADIAPSIFSDRRSLLTSIVELDNSLSRTQKQAERDADRSSGLPQDIRSQQASNAAAIRNFREFLDVPEGVTSEMIEKLGEPPKGGLGAVKDLVSETLKDAAKSAGIGEEATIPKSKKDFDALSIDQLRNFVLGAGDEALEAIPEEIRAEILRRLREGSSGETPSGVKVGKGGTALPDIPEVTGTEGAPGGGATQPPFR